MNFPKIEYLLCKTEPCKKFQMSSFSTDPIGPFMVVNEQVPKYIGSL